jgi:hypothetical protein
MYTTDITRHKVKNSGDKDNSTTDITRYREADFTRHKFTNNEDKDSTTDITRYTEACTTDVTLDKHRISLTEALLFMNEQNSEDRFLKYRNLFS